MDDLSTFRKFSSMEDAQEYQNILIESGIPAKIVGTPPGVDLTFLGSTVGHEYEIQLQQNDFDLADSILATYEETKLTSNESDHYLYQFTNDELFEILQKPDEWSKIDYELAKDILSERGEHIDANLIESMKEHRLAQLAEPEKSENYRVILGYIFAFLGGLLGIVIGYVLWNSKKTLPNGEKVWSYEDKDRKQGKAIFFIGIFVFCIFYVSRIIRGL